MLLGQCICILKRSCYNFLAEATSAVKITFLVWKHHLLNNAWRKKPAVWKLIVLQQHVSGLINTGLAWEHTFCLKHLQYTHLQPKEAMFVPGEKLILSSPTVDLRFYWPQDPPEDWWKHRLLEPSQSFWFSSKWVEPENLHFWHIPRWCSWGLPRDHTESLMERIQLWLKIWGSRGLEA